jgi:hypothetical protein
VQVPRRQIANLAKAQKADLGAASACPDAMSFGQAQVPRLSVSIPLPLLAQVEGRELVIIPPLVGKRSWQKVSESLVSVFLHFCVSACLQTQFKIVAHLNITIRVRDGLFAFFWRFSWVV